MAFPLIGLLFPWTKILNFGKFFLVHWKETIVVLMLATLIYQNTQERRWVFFLDTIPFYKVQYEEAVKQRDEAIAANETLTKAIETTNKQVQEWKQVSIRLEKTNAELSGELRGLRAASKKVVDDILNEPTPVDCDAAMEYLRDGIPELLLKPKP